MRTRITRGQAPGQEVRPDIRAWRGGFDPSFAPVRIGRAAGSLAERSRVEILAAQVADRGWSVNWAKPAPSRRDQEVPPESTKNEADEVRPTGSLSRAFWAQKLVPNSGRRESGWKANRATQYRSR